MRQPTVQPNDDGTASPRPVPGLLRTQKVWQCQTQTAQDPDTQKAPPAWSLHIAHVFPFCLTRAHFQNNLWATSPRLIGTGHGFPVGIQSPLRTIELATPLLFGLIWILSSFLARVNINYDK
jgi:hypothetical protein